MGLINNDPSAGYDDVVVSIVDYVYDYKVTSQDAWIRAKACLIDSLGVILETLQTSAECRALLGPPFPGTSVTPNGVKVPGTSYQLDAVKGAFDIGAMIRYLDHNDAFPGAEWGHPSDNLGSILALTDVIARTERAAGKETNIPVVGDILEGLIKAYEIQGCFQIKNAFNKLGLDHTILVKIGSTAVASWLLKLPREQALVAVTHAWADGHPLRIYRQSPNAGPRKGWAAGEACKQAVHLALLAKSGQPPLKTVLTAPKWGFYDVFQKGAPFDLPQAFGSWVVENILYKVNTAEGHGMTGVEAALMIADKLKAKGLKPEEAIESISIRTQLPAMIIIDKTGALNNPADRDHCLRYMVAVVLLKGTMIEVDDYQNDSPFAKDQRVEDLRARMTMYEDPALTADYHNLNKRSVPNALTVTLKDGTKMDEILVEFPQGHVARSDTLELVAAKAKRNLALGLPVAKVEEIISLYERKDFASIPVDKFMDLFVAQK